MGGCSREQGSPSRRKEGRKEGRKGRHCRTSLPHVTAACLALLLLATGYRFPAVYGRLKAKARPPLFDDALLTSRRVVVEVAPRGGTTLRVTAVVASASTAPRSTAPRSTAAAAYAAAAYEEEEADGSSAAEREEQGETGGEADEADARRQRRAAAARAVGMYGLAPGSVRLSVLGADFWGSIEVL